MGQSFIGSAKVTYGQTPSFSVRIPKNITLDSDGAAQYSVGVKGKIPSKYVVSVVPDESIVMEEENNLLDNIIADVSAEKTVWKSDELTEDSYNESTNNVIRMQSIDFAKFEGTLNFNVSAEIPKVELKDASDEVKAANKFLSSFGQSDTYSVNPYITSISGITEPEIGSIIYLDSMTVTNTAHSNSCEFEEGYYKLLKLYDNKYVLLVDVTLSALDEGYLEYLGPSFLV